MIARQRDIVAVAALAALCAAAILLLPDVVAVRTVFALPLLFVLPGYALVAALFAGSGARSLDVPMQALLTVALSLAETVLVALVLDGMPWGLRSASWAATLLVLTLAGCAAAAIRGGETPGVSHPRAEPTLILRDLLLLAVAGLLVAAALVLAVTPLPAKKVQGYTALWLVPRAAPAAGVHVGIKSDELEPTSYRLIVRIGKRLAFERGSIELAPGRSWTRTIELPRHAPRETIRAFLYRGTAPAAAYRVVRLWARPADLSS